MLTPPDILLFSSIGMTLLLGMYYVGLDIDKSRITNYKRALGIRLVDKFFYVGLFFVLSAYTILVYHLPVSASYVLISPDNLWISSQYFAIIGTGGLLSLGLLYVIVGFILDLIGAEKVQRAIIRSMLEDN